MYKDVHFGVIASVPLLKLVYFSKANGKARYKIMTLYSYEDLISRRSASELLIPVFLCKILDKILHNLF